MKELSAVQARANRYAVRAESQIILTQEYIRSMIARAWLSGYKEATAAERVRLLGRKVAK